MDENISICKQCVYLASFYAYDQHACKLSYALQRSTPEVKLTSVLTSLASPYHWNHSATLRYVFVTPKWADVGSVWQARTILFCSSTDVTTFTRRSFLSTNTSPSSATRLLFLLRTARLWFLPRMRRGGGGSSSERLKIKLKIGHIQ